MDDMIIDHMTGKEVSVCMEWVKAEGWNPGLHDADVFHGTDPTGSYAARMNGEMVGGISEVSYSSGFRFGGLLNERLLSALVSRFPGQEFGLDVPVLDRQAVDLAPEVQDERIFQHHEDVHQGGSGLCYRSGVRDNIFPFRVIR